MEDLRWRELAAQAVRYTGRHGVVDLLQPAMGRPGRGHRAALLLFQVAAEAGDVVEQAPCLLLVGADPGLAEELTAVVAGFGDPGPHPQPGPFRRGGQYHLVGIEADLVEPAQPFGGAGALPAWAQRLSGCQLSA